jgi:transcription elongation GreA/GreB family factor
MSKQALVKKIIATLVGELELYHKAARAAHAEATHEQSKAENKYDTRGLEASYLARGQSKQAAEIETAITEFEKLTVKDFGAKDPIDLGALVELEFKGERMHYFIGPRAGGTEVMHEKKEVLVITPPSPLGQQLVGKKQGSKVQIEIGGSRSDYKVVSVA